VDWKAVIVWIAFGAMLIAVSAIFGAVLIEIRKAKEQRARAKRQLMLNGED
jgi:hypothetical protein